MCGRFSLAVAPWALEAYLENTYNIEGAMFDELPRYNIAPSQPLIAVIFDGKRYRAGRLKWGLLPSFITKETSSFRPINARIETAPEKPYFRQAFKKRRCLILADGFYEWQREDHKKMPMRIQHKRDPIFAMAGLYETHTDNDGVKTHTVTILTTEANTLIKPIHDRMPVILDRAKSKTWLENNAFDAQPETYKIPYQAEDLTLYPVNDIVNSPKNDIEACIEPRSDKAF